MISVLLVDDHQIVRMGLRTLLETEKDLQIVGEASDGHEALSLIEKLKPMVVIVDIMMPVLNGLELARIIHQRWRDMCVIMLSMHSGENYVTEALKNGANGYVLKDSAAADLITAVREVIAGKHYLSPRLSQMATEAYVRIAKESASDKYSELTTREREVLQLVAQGYTKPQIAAKLVISPRTVESYRNNLLRKLKVTNQAELIKYALLRGIIPSS